MDRFGRVALNIRDLSPEVALHHLVTVLKLGPFSVNLCKKPVNNIDELRQTKKLMELEEMREFKTKLTIDAENRKTEREAPRGIHSPRRPKEFLKPPRFPHYTP